MMDVVSEIETNMIKQRVKSGLENAKAKGVKFGRPKVTIDDIPQNIKGAYDLVKEGKISKSVCAKMCGISRVTLDKYITIIKS